MSGSTIHSANRLDDTLLALADPTRRAIVQRLTRGETRVTDLAAPFPISLNAVSKHIRMLERARLVSRRRVGREHLLSLNAAPLDEATAWIDSQRALWADRLNRLEALLEAEERPHPGARERRTPRSRIQKRRGPSR